MEFFSDSVNGLRPRTSETIPPQVWDGIVALVDNLITTGAFGLKFPCHCSDGNVTIGTNYQNLSSDIQAKIPKISWPLVQSANSTGGPTEGNNQPDTLTILDIVQYTHRAIGKPIETSYHSHCSSHHLKFDIAQGKSEFCESINETFQRNGIAFHLNENGNIERLSPPVLRELVAATHFSTGDPTLDGMLEQSKTKFISPDIQVRKEALDTLWQCFERLKTLDDPADKKKSIAARIARQCPGENFPERITSECKEMKEIGNNFHIRHAEVGKEQLCSPRQIDYLYHRLYCLINLLLQRD
jgi:hypothetical protein